MMKLVNRFLVLFVLLSGACTSTPPPTPVAPTQAATPTLGQPTVRKTSVPDVRAAAQMFLDAWSAEDYAAMYAMLTQVSKDAMPEEDFIKHFTDIATEMTLSEIHSEILSSLVSSPEKAQVGYRVTLQSALVGNIQAETQMNLGLEQGQWRVEWDDTLVLPQLAGGNYMNMEVSRSARANIYDRNGHALVADQTNATAIGLYVDQVDPEQADGLFAELSSLFGTHPDNIRAMYESAPSGQGWSVPIGEVPAELAERRYGSLSQYSGLYMSAYQSRYYFEGGVAPHVVGYVGPIQADEVDEYRRKGYQVDERVGRDGLEKWGEEYLAGKRGGRLTVINAQGQPVSILGESPNTPSQAIYTTLDRDFQTAVQWTLANFVGAAVVLELNTGRVLAIASSPGFDPNAYEPANANYQALLQEIVNNPNQPWLNRATQGLYPLGSVFKIISEAAALESGVFTPDSTLDCQYEYTEIPGVTLYDWTWEHFQDDGKTMPSGLLTLPEGLIRSCNPWFYEVGSELFKQGKIEELSEMARGFGLGSKTGIVGVAELTGQVPVPPEEVLAASLAIGQWDLQVTPLQVANFVAAVGNGGTLYTPQVIEKIVPPVGEPSFLFKPEERGKLPVSPENLQVIQEAMLGVIESKQPRGTAYHVFTGLNIPVAGKTGTAQSGNGPPHAWFAGYTMMGREDKPDIAIAVVAENAGEGSDIAAPIFRRIVEEYFRGSPGRLLPWESTYYVIATPEPEETEEPVEEEVTEEPIIEEETPEP